MRWSWDEGKRAFSLRKHGVDLADCPRVFDGLTLTLPDARFDYPEARYITLGLLADTVVVIAHTETEAEIRIISARKATRREREGFFKAIEGRR